CRHFPAHRHAAHWQRRAGPLGHDTGVGLAAAELLMPSHQLLMLSFIWYTTKQAGISALSSPRSGGAAGRRKPMISFRKSEGHARAGLAGRDPPGANSLPRIGDCWR